MSAATGGSDPAEPSRRPGGPPPFARRLVRRLAPLLVLALSWLWLSAAERTPDDRSDEPEWAAISIAHARQLFLDEEPPGTAEQRAAGELSDNEWRRGVQATTFGAVNPCVPKLAWGLTALAGGHANAPPTVFQKFHRRNPQVARQAWRATEPAQPAMRRVVVALVSLSALFVFVAARHAFGWSAALVAWAAWCSSPLIQTWSHYLRPDFFMVAFTLATLAAATTLAAAIGGRHGATKQVLAIAALGLVAGLTVSSKLNGAVACFFVAVGVPAAALVAREGRPRIGALALGLGSAGLATLVLLYLLNPVLWSDPLGEGREILAFWKQHMQFQADRWEALGGRAAPDVGARFALAWERAFGRDEPLRAVFDLPGGALLVGLGLAALALRSLGLDGADARVPRARAAIVLAWILVTGLVTTLWLPLDWDRYFFLYVAGMALAEASLVGASIAWFRRWRAR